jgi:hypothetical protein
MSDALKEPSGAFLRGEWADRLTPNRAYNRRGDDGPVARTSVQALLPGEHDACNVARGLWEEPRAPTLLGARFLCPDWTANLTVPHIRSSLPCAPLYPGRSPRRHAPGEWMSRGGSCLGATRSGRTFLGATRDGGSELAVLLGTRDGVHVVRSQPSLPWRLRVVLER